MAPEADTGRPDPGSSDTERTDAERTDTERTDAVGADRGSPDTDGATVDPRAALPSDERALLEAFDRLRPQGTVRWNFDDAVRRLTEPPDWPGRSAPWGGLPADLWERGRSTKASERVLGDVVKIVAQDLTEYTDRAVDESRGLTDRSMAELRQTTLDAVRFLSARIDRLEAALDPLGIEPGEIALPDQDASAWVDLAAAWAGTRGDLPTVVGELGTTGLVAPVAGAGIVVDAVDPRGAVVWAGATSLAGRSVPGSAAVTVTMAEVVDHLRDLPTDSRGCVILSGCIDRAGLQGKVELVDEARRVVAAGGTVVLLVTDQAAWDGAEDPVVRDLLPGRPLHPEAWQLVLTHRGTPGAEWLAPLTGSVHAVVAEVGR